MAQLHALLVLAVAGYFGYLAWGILVLLVTAPPGAISAALAAAEIDEEEEDRQRRRRRRDEDEEAVDRAYITLGLRINGTTVISRGKFEVSVSISGGFELDFDLPLLYRSTPGAGSNSFGFTFTVSLRNVDGNGELLKLLDLADDEELAVNTPEGASAVDGWPSSASFYWTSSGWVARPDSPGPFLTWDPTSKAWVDLRSLEDQRAAKRDAIKQQRDQAIASVKSTSVGDFGCSDERAQLNLANVIALMQIKVARGMPAVENFTLATDERKRFTLDQLQTAALEIGAHVQSLYDQADVLFQQIEAASIEQLDAINWPTG